MKYLKYYKNYIDPKLNEGYKDVSLEYVKSQPKLWSYLPSDYVKKYDNYVLVNIFDSHWYNKKPNEIWGKVMAFDKEDGTEIGNAHYGLFTWFQATVDVRPDKKRTGVATAMYCYIEEVTGMKLSPGVPHSDDAEAFWTQPNRPFGEEEDI